jgi:hypothetical protein
MFIKAEPLHGVREIPDEREYEMNVLAMRKELGHDVDDDDDEEEGSEPHALTMDESTVTSPSSPAMAKLPPIGDEVLLEFGRPPLRAALRQWSDGFGKRTCVYGLSPTTTLCMMETNNLCVVCGPPSMKVDVSNAVAEMQNDIWISDEREEVYLHTESFGW